MAVLLLIGLHSLHALRVRFVVLLDLLLLLLLQLVVWLLFAVMRRGRGGASAERQRLLQVLGQHHCSPMPLRAVLDAAVRVRGRCDSSAAAADVTGELQREGR